MKQRGTAGSYFKTELVWKNILIWHIFSFTPFGALYLYNSTKFITKLYAFLLGIAQGVAINAGAHRLWAHRSYKASHTMQVVLMLLQTMTGQNCLYIWVRDHRQHHKYSDTDADPHNSNRGFFFSHVGWLMMRKHPDVIRYGKMVDLSDLEADPIVMFQKRNYTWMYIVFAFFIPVVIPIWLWNEGFWQSVFVSYFTRSFFLFHFTWLINSMAHFWGTKPYDRTQKSVENKIVAFFTLGEGFHNYHHCFPWDYRAAEHGLHYSVTTWFIDMMARLGLAHGLRRAAPDVVRARARRLGDGSHPTCAGTPSADESEIEKFSLDDEEYGTSQIHSNGTASRSVEGKKDQR